MMALDDTIYVWFVGRQFLNNPPFVGICHHMESYTVRLPVAFFEVCNQYTEVSIKTRLFAVGRAQSVVFSYRSQARRNGTFSDVRNFDTSLQHFDPRETKPRNGKTVWHSCMHSKLQRNRRNPAQLPIIWKYLSAERVKDRKELHVTY